MLKSKVISVFLIVGFVLIGAVYTGHAPDGTVRESDKEKIESTETENVVTTELQLNTEPGLDFNIDPASDKYAGLDSKNYGWGFKKEKGKSPEIYADTVKMFDSTNTYYIDKRGGKVLYLTFDEGYENGYTSAILDVLKDKQVSAAFFITGPYLQNQEELVDRMVNEGHVVGNHTVNHPNLAKSDLSKVYSELKGLEDAFYEKYGKSMIFMRPPEGEYSEKMLSFVSDMGYKTMLWSFAYKDWDVNMQKGSDYAFEQVTPYLHDGAILLLHAVSSDNAGALAGIIDYAREQGYEFKSLDELIN